MSVCMRYANDRQLAQDLLQEGFIKVFASLHQYRAEGSFEGWMRRVFVSMATRHFKKKRVSFVDMAAGQEVEVGPAVLSSLSENEIHALIRKLPDGYRLVFNLNIIEGYSHDEIAAMLGIQPATSRTQLLKARKMLQGLIASHHNPVSI